MDRTLARDFVHRLTGSFAVQARVPVHVSDALPPIAGVH